MNPSKGQNNSPPPPGGGGGGGPSGGEVPAVEEENRNRNRRRSRSRSPDNTRPSYRTPRSEGSSNRQAIAYSSDTGGNVASSSQQSNSSQHNTDFSSNQYATWARNARTNCDDILEARIRRAMESGIPINSNDTFYKSVQLCETDSLTSNYLLIKDWSQKYLVNNPSGDRKVRNFCEKVISGDVDCVLFSRSNHHSSVGSKVLDTMLSNN